MLAHHSLYYSRETPAAAPPSGLFFVRSSAYWWGMSKHLTRMTIYDAEHYTDEQRADIIASYKPHIRDARAMGIPVLGSGRIYPVSEADISIKPFKIPDYWARIGGLDFGWDHPTAAIEMAHDRDNDIVYVTQCYRAKEKTPAEHAIVLRPWNLPAWAWPHDGHMRGRGTGEQFKTQYADEGLEMLFQHAQSEDGSISVEAGVSRILQRMQKKRFKVFSHLEEWFSEFRIYHRKDGVIVDDGDDLMSATRYAETMIRFAEVPDRLQKLMQQQSGRRSSTI